MARMGGMDAVFSKAERAAEGKRAPMLKRKPGVAIIMAVGKPKMGPPGKAMAERPDEDEVEDGTCPECGYKHSKKERMGEDLSKSDKVAALEEKIGYLKAELALLKGEDDEEMDDESEDEDEYEDEED